MAEWTSRCNGTYGSHYTLKLVATEGTYSVVNNQTPVTVTLYIKADSGYKYYGYTSYGTIFINGNSHSQQSTGSEINENGWVQVASNTDTITHNSDGSKSISVSAAFDTTYGKLTYSEIAGTFTLTKRERYFTNTPVLTYQSATETTMNFSWSTSEICSQAVLYRNGVAVQTKSSLNTTSGNFDAVTGLTENTSYQWYVACTRKDSGLISNSTSQTRATYPYPSVAKIGTSAIILPVPGTNISQSIVLNNPLNRTNVTVYAKKDNTSGTQFGSVTNSSSALTNLTLTLTTNTMYSSIPNSTNGNVVYYCVYNDGSANHTSATVAGTFATSETNCGPTVSANPTYTNTNSTHTSLVGADTIIQGKSSFSVTSPTITTRGSATVAKYYFKIGNGNYENATTQTKTYTSTSLSGNVIAYCYAEDSRGYTSVVKQVTMRILAYSTPSATISVTRNGYSTSGTVTVSATRSTLSKSSATSTDVNNWRGNTSSNRVSLAISPTDATLAAETIGSAGNFTNQSVSVSNLNLEKSYTITVNISDRISTVTKTVVIEKASPILSMNAVSSAVGIDMMVTDTSTSGLHTKSLYVVNPNQTGGPRMSVEASSSNLTLQTDGANISINPNVSGSINIYDDVYIRDGMGLRVTGQGAFEKGIKGKTISGGEGTAGYFYVCDITTTDAYVNQYMKFDILQRGRIGHVEIYFSSTSTAGSLTVAKINKSGTSNVYYTCVDNVFKLYVQKSESYDNIEIVNWEKGNYSSNLNIVWKDSTVASLPSEYITVNEGSPSFLGMYPVGSIYISVNNVNPSTYFGGTWEAFATGRTLIGMGSNGTTNYTTVEATGGSETNWHYHGLGAGYARIILKSNGNIRYNEVDTVGWTDNYAILGSHSTSSSGSTQYYGATLGGTTDGNTIDIRQPYITVYMWKRTA